MARNTDNTSKGPGKLINDAQSFFSFFQLIHFATFPLKIYSSTISPTSQTPIWARQLRSLSLPSSHFSLFQRRAAIPATSFPSLPPPMKGWIGAYLSCSLLPSSPVLWCPSQRDRWLNQPKRWSSAVDLTNSEPKPSTRKERKRNVLSHLRTNNWTSTPMSASTFMAMSPWSCLHRPWDASDRLWSLVSCSRQLREFERVRL